MSGPVGLADTNSISTRSGRSGEPRAEVLARREQGGDALPVPAVGQEHVDEARARDLDPLGAGPQPGAQLLATAARRSRAAAARAPAPAAWPRWSSSRPARASAAARASGRSQSGAPSPRASAAERIVACSSSSGSGMPRNTRAAPRCRPLPRAVAVGDGRADPLDGRRVGPDQGGDDARAGPGWRRWRAPGGAGPGSAPRGSCVSRSAKVSALASTWRESWLPGTPRTSAATASPSDVARAGRPGPRRSDAGARARAAAQLAREQQPQRGDQLTNASPRGTSSCFTWPSSWATIAAQLRAVRAARAGCRRGPPAWSGPIPST